MNDAFNDNITIRRERAGADAPPKRKTPSSASSKQPDNKPSAPLRPPSSGAWAKIEKQKMKIVAILLVLFAVFMLLALLSYTPHDEASASLTLRDFASLLRGDEAVRARADTTQNWLGLLGAMLSSFCYNFTIGYASLMYPVLLILWSKHLYKENITRRLVLITTLSLTFGVLFSAYAGTVQLVSWIPTFRPEWSGAIGQFIAGVFSQLVGTVGSFLLLTGATVVVLVVGVDLDIEKTFFRLKIEIAKLRDKMEARRKMKLRELEIQTPAPTITPIESEENEEPARVLKRQAEQQGTAMGRKDIIKRYSEPEPEDEGAMVDRSTGEIIPPRLPVPPVIRRPEPVVSPLTDIPPAQAEEEKTAPVIAVQHQVKKAEDLPRSVVSEVEIIPYSRPTAVPAVVEEITKPLTLTVQEVEEEEKVQEKVFMEYNPLDEDILYDPPTVDLLIEEPEFTDVDDEELKENARLLQEKLKTFKIDIENLAVTPGPVVTQYEFVPAAGIKVSQIENLSDDIALALKARGIRIIAPVPGRGTVAVEIPNTKPKLVRFSSILRSPKFLDAKHRLPIALGKTISGEVFCDDLAKMPHLLIAGSTGSGKSVGINTIICSLLYKMHPRYLKFMIIDPKKIEMTQYRPLTKHFLAICPDIDEEIITNPQNAIIALNSVVAEMERRYDVLAKVGQRNIADYNKKVSEGKYKDTTDFVHREMPYIIVVIDELADLMMTAGRDVEEPITRLAQLARAIGIHLVVATQRPSVDVITGIIKANFPARIAYQVASKIDSRTILDASGAEHLLGNGDMLYLPGGSPKPIRIQNSFMSTEEVEALCDHIGHQVGYSQSYMLPSATGSKNGGKGNTGSSDDRDDLFDEAAHLIVRHQQGSVSLLQRRLKVGYSRAARIVDQLEEAGIVGPFDGSKARAVLLESEAELEAYL